MAGEGSLQSGQTLLVPQGTATGQYLPSYLGQGGRQEELVEPSDDDNCTELGTTQKKTQLEKLD